MKKRAQVTVFIIIGLLILGAIGLVFYYKARADAIPKVEAEPFLEEVPVEFQPLQKFVADCVQDTAVKGLEAIGRYGGYAEPPDYGIVSIAAEPTEYPSTALNFGGEWDIAYWWYLDSQNNCERNCFFNSKKPPLSRNDATRFMPRESSIEIQLDNYVNANLRSCLGGFSTFKKQGLDIIELGLPKTTTTIAESDVRIAVSYPLEASIGDRESRLKTFYQTIPVNFKKIYSMAEEIVNKEMSEKYLETHVLNLISVYSDIDSEALPPMDDSVTGFGAVAFWTEYNTERRLQEMLMPNIQGLHVPGSSNYRVWNLPNSLTSSLYNTQMNVPVQGDRSLAVKFEYLNWPIYFDTGSEGGIIQGEFVGITAPVPLGIRRYNTVYDLSVPVAVEIYDPDALNKKGYSFRFGMEACIRNNEPCLGAVSLDSFNIPTGSMLCDIEQRTSEEISFSAMDSDGNALQDAIITYTCVDESCDIGVTDENGILKSKLPPCVGAVVSFRKPEYLGVSKIEASLVIIIEEGRGHDPITGVLEPYKEVDIDVKKVVRAKLNKKWTDQLSAPEELDADEEGLLTMSRIKTITGGNIEEDFPPAVARFDNTGKVKLKLVPGDYEVNIYLMREDALVIPPRKKEVGSWPNKKKFWMPGPEPMVLNKRGSKFPSGNAVFNEKTGYLHLDKEDLGKGITLYAISHNLFDLWEKDGLQSDIRIEDLEIAMPEPEEVSIMYNGAIQPGFE